MKKHLSSVVALLIMGSLVTPVFAAPAAQGRRPDPQRSNANPSRTGFGFAAFLERTVNLTPEQRDAVRGLLAQQRQKSQELRAETDAKIRALLNSDQQKKFDALLAEQKARRANKLARSQ